MRPILNEMKRLSLIFGLQAPEKPDNKHGYYQSFVQTENLCTIEKMLQRMPAKSFETTTPILFQGVDMENGLYTLMQKMGLPSYKTKTKYGRSVHTVLVYRSLFCGYKVKTVINAFDDQILSCTYYIRIDNRESLDQLKLIFKNKYHVDTESDEFSFTDEVGKRIWFKYQFEAVINYMNIDAIGSMIHYVSSVREHIREKQRQRQMEKMQLAF